MNIKSIIRDLRNKSLIIQLAWNQYRFFRWKWLLKVHDDYKYICKTYKKSLGININLAKPERFTEKLQWLKLFYRDSVMQICSDKYEVREYLKEKGYAHLLNELIAIHDNIDDIDTQKLPDKFVIKAAHGSGWNLIVKDKNKVNWFMWKRIMKSWLKQNLYWFGREWNYASQKPRIIIEKYLEDDTGELRDYKFFCFSGVVKYFKIDYGRYTTHRANYYDRNSMLQPFGEAGYMPDLKEIIQIPSNISQMITIAEELSQKFPFCRVDFYSCDGKIIFGEMTFFPASGFGRFEPDEYDKMLGNHLILPDANHNLELYAKVLT